MKIVALIAFKNEEKLLRTYVSSLAGIVDEIVAINDFSKDSSVEILEKTSKEFNIPVQIHEGISDKKNLPVEKLRQKLLDLGRAANGTHFVCLDADEAFTANFIPNARKIISKLNPGQKLVMQWLAMWKSTDHYRNDQSVWSNNYKDFIVFDDGKLQAETGIIHKGRTPGPNTEETKLQLNNKYGAVFHFQFSDWSAFQMKQAWYRCFEKSIGRPDQAVNSTYSITLDDPNAVVTAIPESWLLAEQNMPKILYNKEPSWHLEEIERLFKTHGWEQFKNLDIWHIPEICKLKEE